MCKIEKWEIIHEEDVSQTTERLKVLGGWLVLTIVPRYKNEAVFQIFLPDPEHQWKI